MCYSLWYNATTMLSAGSLEADEECHTGLLTACEQEQMLLLTSCQHTRMTLFVRFQATGRQHRGCIIPQAVTHSLVLLKMDKIIARNMLSFLELLINRYCCIKLVFISFISMMHGQSNIRCELHISLLMLVLHSEL